MTELGLDSSHFSRRAKESRTGEPCDVAGGARRGFWGPARHAEDGTGAVSRQPDGEAPLQELTCHSHHLLPECNQLA